MMNGLIFCFVLIWISAATGFHDVERTVGLNLRKKACRNLGGQCVKKRKACPGDLSQDTLLGRPYCNRRRRCCYPAPPIVAPETIECGIENTDSNRIVHGEVIEINRKYSWMVGLKRKNGIYPKRKYFCGGSIITKRHILTAAHCFYKYYENGTCIEKIPSKVYLGYGNNWQDETYALNLTILVTRDQIFPHHDFNCTTLNYDIAVLKLDESVDLLSRYSNMHPICLPKDGNTDYTGSDGIVTGWGSIVGYNPGQNVTPILPNGLEEAILPVLKDDYCETRSDDFTNKMLCAATNEGFENPNGEGKAPCQGDSGGPLTVKEKSGGLEKHVQIGIVSFGHGCASKDNPDYFARVTAFLQWINEMVEPLSPYTLK